MRMPNRISTALLAALLCCGATTAAETPIQPMVLPAPANPAVGVVSLEPVDQPLVTVASGAAVVLSVRASAGAQVGFLTRDGGTMVAVDGAALPTIKGAAGVIVTAGADGVAKARYVATPDVTAIANVLATSAQCSGKVTWAMQITDAAHPAH